MNYAIIVAGGKGKRFSSKEKKQFYKLGSKTILELTLNKFINHPEIEKIILVIPEEDKNLFTFNHSKLFKIVFAGSERKYSVLNGLKAIEHEVNENDKILIHDGVRPFLSNKLISNLLNELEISDCVVPVIKLEDTIKEVENGIVVKTVNRDKLVRVQTPQGFKGKLLRIFFDYAIKDINFTDDASIFEVAGINIRIIEGEKRNIKITTKEDIMNIYSNILVGFGYDVHKFSKERELYLGGVKINYEYGLEGHSDADVLIHSIIDGILGAASIGDIGELFPDSNKEYKNIRSTILLEKVLEKISDTFLVNNIDCTIVCEKPKLKDYKNIIKLNLAKILNISENRVNIKATTTEGLGFTGRKEGIACYSVVSLIKI